MFESVTTAPPDAIFGLSEDFKRDPNPDKINLSVGVYKDEAGTTPILEAVKEAERRILATELTKSYLPIPGSSDYTTLVKELVLGPEHPAVVEERAITVHTPGGTGALRVAADFLAANLPGPTVHLTNPTWINHLQIFPAAGLPVAQFRYFDAAHNALDFGAMMDDLAALPAGDVVVLHGCCHNPSGVDPTLEQWRRLGELLVERHLLPILDFAYQGFFEGLDEDAAGVRTLSRIVPEMLICNSFSKNLGLYNERVGGLTVVTTDPDRAQAVLSQVKRSIRASYSNPPAHGGLIVTTILSDPELGSVWLEELDGMRKRIREMRTLFAAGLDERGVRLSPEGNGFLAKQKGMFSFSGLRPEHVAALRDRFSIYLVGSGRVSISALT